MKQILKYENINEELPKLSEILLNTIQADILEIKKIDKCCKRFNEAIQRMPKLQDTEYVVFSKYIERANHPYEKFIFLSKEGKEIFDASGTQIELYQLLAATNLRHTPEYEASLKDK